MSKTELDSMSQIENQTKEDIKSQIFALIYTLPETEARLMDDLYQKTVKGKTKTPTLISIIT